MKESKKMEVSPIRKMRWMWNENKERGGDLRKSARMRGRQAVLWYYGTIEFTEKNDIGCIERWLRDEWVLLAGNFFFLLAGIIIVQLQ